MEILPSKLRNVYRTGGGVLTEDDLANYQPEWVEPISVDYKNGYTFHEIPPNGQGLTALASAQILPKGSILQSLGLWHGRLLSRADGSHQTRLCRCACITSETPNKSDVPIDALLSDAYTAATSKLLNLARNGANTPVHGQSEAILATLFISPLPMRRAIWSAGFKVCTWGLAVD